MIPAVALSLDLKEKPSIRVGLHLGLKLDPMILIGSDLTNERALTLKRFQIS